MLAKGPGSNSFPLLSGVSIPKQWLHTAHMLPHDFNLGSLGEMLPFKLKEEENREAQNRRKTSGAKSCAHRGQ